MRTLGLFILYLVAMSCASDAPQNHYQKSWSEADRTFLTKYLKASLDSVLDEVNALNDHQWNWKQSDTTWSVAMVVEHLIVHDELFYREARVLTGIPEMNPQPDSLFASDLEILSYRVITSQNTGKSPSYMEPLGRWSSKENATNAYLRIRGALIDFVAKTNTDLRKIYTSSGRGPTKYRDLHQLLLISVAHTERHLKQIKKIKRDANFPAD